MEPAVASSGPVVELDDAVAVLGRFPALAGVTMSVERGEILASRSVWSASMPVSTTATVTPAPVAPRLQAPKARLLPMP